MTRANECPSPSYMKTFSISSGFAYIAWELSLVDNRIGEKREHACLEMSRLLLIL